MSVEDSAIAGPQEKAQGNQGPEVSSQGPTAPASGHAISSSEPSAASSQPSLPVSEPSLASSQPSLPVSEPTLPVSESSLPVSDPVIATSGTAVPDVEKQSAGSAPLPPTKSHDELIEHLSEALQDMAADFAELPELEMPKNIVINRPSPDAPPAVHTTPTLPPQPPNVGPSQQIRSSLPPGSLPAQSNSQLPAQSIPAAVNSPQAASGNNQPPPQHYFVLEGLAPPATPPSATDKPQNIPHERQIQYEVTTQIPVEPKDGLQIRRMIATQQKMPAAKQNDAADGDESVAAKAPQLVERAIPPQPAQASQANEPATEKPDAKTVGTSSGSNQVQLPPMFGGRAVVPPKATQPASELDQQKAHTDLQALPRQDLAAAKDASSVSAEPPNATPAGVPPQTEKKNTGETTQQSKPLLTGHNFQPRQADPRSTMSAIAALPPPVPQGTQPTSALGAALASSLPANPPTGQHTVPAALRDQPQGNEEKAPPTPAALTSPVGPAASRPIPSLDSSGSVLPNQIGAAPAQDAQATSNPLGPPPTPLAAAGNPLGAVPPALQQNFPQPSITPVTKKVVEQDEPEAEGTTHFTSVPQANFTDQLYPKAAPTKEITGPRTPISDNELSNQVIPTNQAATQPLKPTLLDQQRPHSPLPPAVPLQARGPHHAQPTSQGASSGSVPQVPQSQSHPQLQSPPQSQSQFQSQSHPQLQSQPQLPSQSQSQIPPQSQLPRQSQSQFPPQSQAQLPPQSQAQLPPQSQSQLQPQSQSQLPFQSQSQLQPQSQSQLPPQSQSPLQPQSQSQLPPQSQSQLQLPFQTQSQSQPQQQQQQQPQPQQLGLPIQPPQAPNPQLFPINKQNNPRSTQNDLREETGIFMPHGAPAPDPNQKLTEEFGKSVPGVTPVSKPFETAAGRERREAREREKEALNRIQLPAKMQPQPEPEDELMQLDEQHDARAPASTTKDQQREPPKPRKQADSGRSARFSNLLHDQPPPVTNNSTGHGSRLRASQSGGGLSGASDWMRNNGRVAVIALLAVPLVVSVSSLMMIAGKSWLGVSMSPSQRAGEEAFNEGNYDRAVNYFNEAIKLDTKRPDLYHDRARANLRLQNYAAAVSDYTSALKLDQNYSGARLDRAAAYYYLGDYDKAIADYDELIKGNSNNIDAYFGRGLSYSKLHRYEPALADLNKVVQLNPRHPGAFEDVANAYLAQGQLNEAVDAYSKSLKNNPRDANAYYMRANTYKRLGKTTEALNDFSSAIDVAPGRYEFYNDRGFAQYESGKYKEAIADLSMALALNPTYEIAKHNRNSACNKLIEEIGRTAKTPEQLGDLALAYFNLSDYNNAMTAANHALLLNGQYRPALNVRAAIELKQRRFDYALTDADAALKIKADDKDALLTRARCFLNLARYDKAVKDYDTCIAENDNTSLFALRERALAHLLSNEGALAATDAQQFMELNGWHNSLSGPTVLLSWLAKRQLQDLDGANAVLSQAETRLKSSQWPYSVIKFLKREISLSALNAMTRNDRERTDVRTWSGFDHMLGGLRDEARADFEWVKKNGYKDNDDYLLASEQLKADEAH